MTDRPIAPITNRVAAVVDALTDGGQLTEGALQQFAVLDEILNWNNGARVVARAWSDASFWQRLLADGTAACSEMGFEGPEGEYIVALEDTPRLKNVIVCTQCSCTAWPVLGLPPDWYKSPEYRARVAREPRRVLSEMGLELEDDVQVRVWDTTAETRYIVVPLRPAGTEQWSEDQLAGLVTREALNGVARVELPKPPPAIAAEVTDS